MIEGIDISKKFGKVLLLNHLNFTIPKGSRTLIKEINGSGKSVLLRMISGLSKPTEGIVNIDGQQLGKAFDFIPSAGIFINSSEFMSNWTGWQNLRYLADIKKIAKDEEIHQLAQLLDLDKDLDKKYRTYSLGMK